MERRGTYKFFKAQNSHDHTLESRRLVKIWQRYLKISDQSTTLWTYYGRWKIFLLWSQLNHENDQTSSKNENSLSLIFGAIQQMPQKTHGWNDNCSHHDYKLF